MDKELYQLISNAREACAGCQVKETSEVIDLIQRAQDYIANHCEQGSKEFAYWGELRSIKRQMLLTNDYGGRLPVDTRLCNILNEMLEDE